MKTFLLLFVNLGTIAFILCAIGTFLNAFFGLHLGYKGNELPDDAMIGVVFVMMAALFGVAAYFVNKRADSSNTPVA